MIVADTSALVSIASIDLLETVLTEFEIHTTERVVEELEETSGYDDRHGDAAADVLDDLDRIDTHHVEEEFTSSRVDQGEGGCALLTGEVDAAFLVTDDLRALPELKTVADAQVAISPVVLKALVEREALSEEDALENLDDLAERRDWLGEPIYRRARNLFEQ